jgi:cell wall-associated NlpC family hydrolase
VAGKAGTVVKYARAQVGKAYRFATSGPGTFDCSGLVVAAYRQIGISLPHQTGALSGRGRAVSRASLQPGDLIFPHSGHVAIYVGGGMMVHASNSKPYPQGGVKLSTIYQFSYARRIL